VQKLNNGTCRIEHKETKRVKIINIIENLQKKCFDSLYAYTVLNCHISSHLQHKMHKNSLYPGGEKLSGEHIFI